MRPTPKVLRTVVLATAVVAWITCFRLLVLYRTWLPFVAAGSLLAAFSLLSQQGTRSLFRPSLSRTAIGIAGAAIMVACTYAGFAVLRRLLPSIDGQTRALYVLFHSGDGSDLLRAVLIGIVATAEEIIFRGTLLGGESSTQRLRVAVWPDRTRVARIALYGGLYAATAAASGNPLLVVVALICSLYWGWLRVVSGSLLAPIVAHIAWDLSILVFRPLL